MQPELADLEYNPRLRVPDFARYFSQWRGQSEAVRNELEWRELAYGSAESERLDFFPAAAAQAPLLVFLHGGYWRALDKSDFSWIAPNYVAAGAAVAVVNYGLAPGTPIEKIVAQVFSAVSWLEGHAGELGIAHTRIVVGGHSAGAHLAAMLLTAPGPVHASIGLSGIFDLRPLVDAPFLQDLQLSDERAGHLSPVLMRPLASSLLLLAVGETESAEFHRQSAALRSAWSRGPVRITGPVVAPGQNHFSVCEAWASPRDALFQATIGLLGASHPA